MISRTSSSLLSISSFVRVSPLPLLIVFSVSKSLLSDLKPYLPPLPSSTSSEQIELVEERLETL
ncbi:hypothetical protein Sjap_005504 [Stephania japonica]|uniref:Uncharacterized protein n=1 Tax=Stephania japonica TaxID=461633 RepID=A0AAP0PLX6_9MAGN